jgi:hypothetical protein
MLRGNVVTDGNGEEGGKSGAGGAAQGSAAHNGAGTLRIVNTTFLSNAATGVSGTPVPLAAPAARRPVGPARDGPVRSPLGRFARIRVLHLFS